MDIFLGVRLDNEVARKDVLWGRCLNRVARKCLLRQSESLLVSLELAGQFEFVQVSLNNFLLYFFRHVGNHTPILFKFQRVVILR